MVRMFLLKFDGYQCHITSHAIESLREGGVLLYCLPFHAIRKTQLFEIGLYRLFKEVVRRESKKAENCMVFQRLKNSTFFIWHGDLEKRFLSRTTSKALFCELAYCVLWFYRPKSAEKAHVMSNREELEGLLEFKHVRIRVGVFFYHRWS